MEELKKKITDYLNKNKISIAKLEKTIGLSNATIIKLLDGSAKNPTLETVLKIANTLDCSLDELLGRTEYIKKYFLKSNDGTAYNDELFRSVCFYVMCFIEVHKIQDVGINQVVLLIKEIHNNCLEQNLQTVSRGFAEQLLRENLLN